MASALCNNRGSTRYDKPPRTNLYDRPCARDVMSLSMRRLLLALVVWLLSGGGAEGGRTLLQNFGNSDTYLLYSNSGSVQQWNATSADGINSTGYFVVAAAAVSLGSVVVEGHTNSQPSATACALSCATYVVNQTRICDTFNFCDMRADRCVVEQVGMAMLGGSCELRSQRDVRLGLGMFVTRGSRGIFTGAPVTVSAVEIPGYVANLGKSFAAGRYSYDCISTYKRGVCMVLGTPQELAIACNADPRCVGFSAFPLGSSDFTGMPMGYLLQGGWGDGSSGTLDLGWSNLNPASVLYVNASTLPKPSPAPAPSTSRAGPTGPVAEVDAAPPAGLGQGAVQQLPSNKGARKPLKGGSLVGVIVGAGIAAAALGTLAGYVVFRRRTTLDQLAASPGKLRSLYGNGLATIAGSLPSAGRRSFARAAHGSHKAARSSSRLSVATLEENEDDDSALVQETPSKARMSQLFSRWSDCLVSHSEIKFFEDANGRRLSLGKGASGTVYNVQLHGHMLCAAKAIELGGPETEHWFIQEASLLRRLRHPNVVTFIGVAVSNGCGYLLMEFMAAKDLFQAIQLRSQADGSRIFNWYQRGRRVAMDVAQGLAYLHQKNVVHLDLKSQNILLTSPGFVAKIGDCGYARIKMQTCIGASELGGRIGTWAWCAPEILMNQPCDEKADIFSFGVVLWEICTGEQPQRGQMPALRAPEQCPEEVAALHLRCVDPSPSVRPTAKEIVELLGMLASPQRKARRARSGPLASVEEGQGQDPQQHLGRPPLPPGPAAGVGRAGGCAGTEAMSLQGVQEAAGTVEAQPAKAAAECAPPPMEGAMVGQEQAVKADQAEPADKAAGAAPAEGSPPAPIPD